MYLFSRSFLFACLLNLQGCDQIANRISGGGEDRGRNRPDGVAEERVSKQEAALAFQPGRGVNDAVRVHNTTEEEVIFRGSHSFKDKDVVDASRTKSSNAIVDSGLGVSLTTEGGALAPRIRLQGDSGAIELKSDH